MTDLVPCAVVVDSRNLLGQTRRMFGSPGCLSIPGIKAALEGYGFQAVEIRVGMATRLLQQKCADHVHGMQQRNVEVAARLEGDGARVLRGYLAERGPNVEEKQVDVLCAVAVADLAERILVRTHEAQCIVCLSEDMDLMPAYDFAAARGVRVFAAATDSVHVRPEQKDWLILDEAALDSCCPSSSNANRLAVRSALARQVAHGNGDRKKWRADTKARNLPGSSRHDAWEMSANNGARGLFVPRASLAYGRTLELWPQDMGVSAGSGQISYPYVQLAETAGTAKWSSTGMGTVLNWESASRMRVELDDGTQVRCWAPIGSAHSGARVALARTNAQEGDGDPSWAYVGPVPELNASPLLPLRRELLTVTSGKPSPAWLTASLVRDGREVALLWKDAATRPRLGDTVVGVKAMNHPNGAMEGYVALSTPLPRLQPVTRV